MVDAEGISPMITGKEEKEDILRCNEFNSPCFLTEILVLSSSAIRYLRDQVLILNQNIRSSAALGNKI